METTSMENHVAKNLEHSMAIRRGYMEEGTRKRRVLSYWPTEASI